MSVEFDARTTEMNASRGIGWSTVEGEVRFRERVPGRTRIEVTMNYADPSGGKVGEVAANLLSRPERSMQEGLQNFARIVELGGPGDQALSH